MTARVLALGLLVAVGAATVARSSTPDAQSLPASSTSTGSHPGPRTTPGSHLRPPGVAGMTQPQLEQTARYVARHGGITGTCAGCATRYMQHLALELVMRAFPPGSKAWAVCVVERESGANPGAVSQTHDHGLAQINAIHSEFSTWLLTHDPVYSVAAFLRLSERGRDRSPWNGGRYSCP